MHSAIRNRRGEELRKLSGMGAHVLRDTVCRNEGPELRAHL